MNAFPKIFIGFFLIGLLCLQGCAMRSISNSGYTADSRYRGQTENSGAAIYKGELSEYQVLGISPGSGASEAEIKKSLTAGGAPVLQRGGPVLLIQSGALFPDEAMVRAMSRHFTVTTFSGVPEQPGASDYSAALRLAAARAGCRHIMVYWGLLETSRQGDGGKAVSWLPLVGGAIPDESQHMRIRLKAALMETQSGRWLSFAPPPFEHTASSSRNTREAVDSGQVELLKAKAYERTVQELLQKHAR